MRSEKNDRPPKVRPEIAAEAAVWIARLHGPDRSPQMERDCLAWQARSPLHGLAFERGTDIWQDAAGVTLRSYARANGPATHAAAEREQQARTPRGRRCALGVAAAATVAALAGALVLQPWRAGEVYETAVGEQRTVMLPDGSRLSLNTATRVRVALAAAQRTVTVERGEALFEVAKDASRPFVVQAAGTEVTATGTAFVVRLAPQALGGGEALAVTLVEGQVIVRGPAGSPLASPVVMTPGQRVLLGPDAPAGARPAAPAPAPAPREAAPLDRAQVDQLLAWTRGEVVFDDMTLPQAVAEMNRYNRIPIRLAATDTLAQLRVSGLFRTGDSAGFAHAAARLHGLAVHERPDGLELAPK